MLDVGVKARVHLRNSGNAESGVLNSGILCVRVQNRSSGVHGADISAQTDVRQSHAVGQSSVRSGTEAVQQSDE